MMRSSDSDCDMDRLYAEASHWIILSDERELSDHEANAFETWRSSSVQHDAAFRKILSTWDRLPEVDNLTANFRPTLIAVEKSGLVSSSLPATASRTPIYRRVAVGAIAASLLVVAVSALPDRDPTYSTGLAKIRRITLSDGSHVTLGANSKLSVNFQEHERKVELSQGEVFFEIAHDVNKPFFVKAGSSLVRVIGTKFDVNYSASSIRVAVLKGVVEVQDRQTTLFGAPPNVRILRAQQGTEIATPKTAKIVSLLTSIGLSKPEELRTFGVRTPGVWRDGRLVYENGRLGDLVADVNRYYGPGVKLNGSDLGNIRITAAFKTSQVPEFISALDGIIPVKTTEGKDGVIVIEPRS